MSLTQKATLLLVVTSVCSACSVAPTATEEAPPNGEPVDSPATSPTPALDVVLPAPAGPTATFVVRRHGQPGYEREPTRVKVGKRNELVPLGERRAIPIGASHVELQRIRIDGRDYLVEVAPGEELVLWDNPCNQWQLSVPHGNANHAEAADVRCTPRSEACPGGFAPSPLPGLADDPLCDTGERRCVRNTTMMIEGQSIEVDGEPIADGTVIERGPTVCDFSEVRIDEDRVRLIPPIGGQWQFEVEGGRLTGRVRTP